MDLVTTTEQQPLSPAELHAVDAYWRAANYLSVGQIYLMGGSSSSTPGQAASSCGVVRAALGVGSRA